MLGGLGSTLEATLVPETTLEASLEERLDKFGQTNKVCSFHLVV